MDKQAILVLADGSVYEGLSFGADVDACGEVVFNTAMTGYQGMLSDPSCAGQIVIAAYPLIGNCGINDIEDESERIQVRGLAVRELAAVPSHYQSQKTLDRYLAEAGIPGIAALDTRAITRKLRTQGSMMGLLSTHKTPEQAREILSSALPYDQTDFAPEISLPVGRWHDDGGETPYHVAVLNCGCSLSILRLLRTQGCAITVMPSTASTQDILALNPDGLLISPGPGNPELLSNVVPNVQELARLLPVMGIGLGCQLITQAFGGRNIKLKFGHHGSNYPVQDLRTGYVYITAQNHGYAPDPASLPSDLEVSHLNLNDNTIEGLRHKALPVYAIQYYSATSPGAPDAHIFEELLAIMQRTRV